MSVRRDPRVLLSGPPVRSIEQYRADGGGKALLRALRTPPDKIIDVVRRAGLRGRGGAGFPTATKWEGIANSTEPAKYICCNGAEGEPGTFKDRHLLRHNPYQVLEGLAIGALVTGAQRAYMCLKRNFERETEAVQRALNESGPMAENIELVLGPDEYLFGEEKALLEVVEGGLPLPRLLPPYMHGLFAGAYGGPSGNPTVVNNVETLAHATHIVRRGADWYRSMGTDDTPGTMVFTVSGDVLNPTVIELPLGISLRHLVFDVAGGPQAGRRVKAVFPGLANAVVTGSQLDVALGFDSMRRAGSALGSGGFIVYDDSACMVKVAQLFSHFLHIESCNQCPPCKMGSGQISERLERILFGEGQAGELDEVTEIVAWVENGQRCYLPTSEAVVVSSIVRTFPEEFGAHLNGTCDKRHDLVLPKMTDYTEGTGFTYDLTYDRKLPDWSYAIAEDNPEVV